MITNLLKLHPFSFPLGMCLLATLPVNRRTIEGSQHGPIEQANYHILPPRDLDMNVNNIAYMDVVAAIPKRLLVFLMAKVIALGWESSCIPLTLPAASMQRNEEMMS